MKSNNENFIEFETDSGFIHSEKCEKLQSRVKKLEDIIKRALDKSYDLGVEGQPRMDCTWDEEFDTVRGILKEAKEE